MAFQRFTSAKFTTPSGQGWAANPIAGLAPGRLQSPQLTIQFDVSKTIEPKANRASVELFNLSEDQRGLMSQNRPALDDFDLPFQFMDRRLRQAGAGIGARFTAEAVNLGYLELIAGYDTSAPTVFEGHVSDSRSLDEGGHTWRTVVFAEDAAVNILAGQANKGFSSGTPVLNVIRYLAEVANLELAADVDPAKGGILPTEAAGVTLGTVYCDGSPSLLLTQIARGSGFGWFVDDGEIVLIGSSGFRLATPLVIKPGDIIGEPVRVGPDQLRLLTTLKPESRLAGPCQLVSREISGRFRIDGLRHRGNNRGGSFQTILDLRNLDFLQSL